MDLNHLQPASEETVVSVDEDGADFREESIPLSSSLPSESDQILARPLPGGRLLLFLGVLVLHIVAFWLIANLVVFTAPPVPVDDAPMQRIALPTKPVAPPPPPPSGGSAPAMPAFTPPAAAPVTITSPVSVSFTVPKVTLPDDGAAMLAMADHGTGGGTSGAGGNAGAGGSPSESGQGTGDGNGILGAGVGQTANIAVILDVSGSMREFDRDVTKVLRKDYGTADIDDVQDCYSKTLDAAVANICNHNPPDVIVIITDFEDEIRKTTPDLAIQDMVEILERNHVKLTIITKRLAPYDGLPEYAKKSGGLVLTSQDVF